MADEDAAGRPAWRGMTWLALLALVWALQDVPWFANTAGRFLRDHQIGRSAIAAAFVLMAVTMYGLRFAAIALRARQDAARLQPRTS